MIHLSLPILLAAASTAADPNAASPTIPAIDSAALQPYLVQAVDRNERSAFSYTYFEAGYFATNVDALDDSTDAVFARGSIELFDFLYVFAGYAVEEIDNASIGAGTGDVQSDSYQLGLGAHRAMTMQLDLVGEVAWIYDDISSDDIASLDDANDGWTAMVGARYLPMRWDDGGFELNGGFRWQDREALFTDGESSVWEFGGRLHFLTMFSIGAKYAVTPDDDRFALDARVSF